MSLVRKFWLDDVTVLLEDCKVFFPIVGMTNDEKLNAVVRMSFYVAAILFITRKTLNVFLIPLFVMILTIFIHKMNTTKQDSEELQELLEDIEQEQDCQMPTKENPYMNTLISDLAPGVEKKPACKLTRDVRKKQHDLFYEGLFRNTDDLFEKANSERQFFTMPSTTKFGVGVGDTIEFAKFLFNNNNPTCKEDTSECTKDDSRFYESLKSSRNVLIKDEYK